MNQEQHDTQLSVLLADLFASDERDLELLVRYADDASSLSSGERANVEGRLDADPSWQDRLRVLQRFDPAAAFDDDETAVDAETTEPLAPVIELDRYRSPSRVAAWVAVAAAAALVVWLSVPSSRVTNHPAEPTGVALLPIADATPSSVASTNAVEEASPAHEIAEPAPQLAVRGEGVVAPDVANPVSAQVNAQDTAQVSARVGAPAAAQIHADEEPVRFAVSPTPIATAPEPVAPAYDGNSEMQLAMLSAITYEAPADRALRAFLGDDMRGDAAAVSLEAWVPDHVAQSATSQPKLYWGIEGSLPEAHQLGFVITSETETEPLYEGTLAIPPQSGRQIVDLEQLGVELTEDSIYRWTIFARAPSADPSEDRITQGWVQFRAVSSTFAKDLIAASEVELAKRYAEKGYWYDALSLLVGLTERQPEDENVRKALSGFLASAGVERAGSLQ